MEHIQEFIQEFTDREIKGIKQIGRRYFLVSKLQEVLAGKINNDVFSMGLYLGEFKGRFYPSPALVDMLAKMTDKKVYIQKKAEWLFLCGRDVFDSSITVKRVDQGLVMVQNERDENLGYGRIVVRKENLLIKNLLDKGHYLRKEN